MSHARTANLPGAIALGLADNTLDTATGHVAHGGCTPAALSVIGHEPGQTIDFLARVFGMSHPGAVRLVNHREFSLTELNKGGLINDLELLRPAAASVRDSID